MNLFDRIVRDIHEAKLGRIHRCGGHWVLLPDEAREDGAYAIPDAPQNAGYLAKFEKIGTDVEGRKMRLISKRAVHCPNPDYTEQFASLSPDRTCLSVPESFCRKCKFYRTARASRRKYSTCRYAASDNPATETLKEFNQLLSKATEQARNMGM